MNQFENSNSAMYNQYQSSADMMMSGALVTLLKGDQITSQSDIMTDITLGAGGDDTLQVAEGGQVIYTTVNAGGNIFLSSGGIASGTNISSGGGLHVNSGASAWETTVKQGGFFGVGLGAVTYITTIDSAGSLTVWGGGVVNHNNINEYGELILSSGAVASGTIIHSLGGLHVYSGAVASNTVVEQGGFFGVGLGATALDTKIDSGGALTVWGGGTVNSNTIWENGALILSSGAVANGTEILSGGGLHVYSGATANSTTVYQDGFFGVGLGATTYNTVIDSGGSLTVWGGGTVHKNEIRQYGSIILSSGAIANETEINPNGALHIFDGAAAYTTTVTNWATLGIGGGGTLFGSELEEYATMNFYDGSILGGWNVFKGDVNTFGNVNAEGAYINIQVDYDSLSYTDYIMPFPGNTNPVIKNLGDFKGNYHLRVDLDTEYITSTDFSSPYSQARFVLADGAREFNSSINLTIDGTDLGSVVLNQSVLYNGVYYTLDRFGEELTLLLGNKSSGCTGPGAAVADVNTIRVGGVSDSLFEEYYELNQMPAAAKAGSINGTNGADMVIFTANQSRYVDNIYLYDGDDSVVLEYGYDHDYDDSEVNFGRVGVIDFGEGNNTLTVNLDYDLESCRKIVFGSGNDTANIYNEVEAAIIDFGNGNNALNVVGGAADYSSEICFGNGNDTITLSQSSEMSIVNSDGILDMGGGNDTITVEAGSILSVTDLDFGDGYDTMYLNGTLSFTNLYSDEKFPGGISGVENLSGTGTILFHEHEYYDWTTDSYQTIKSVNSASLDYFNLVGFDIVNVGHDNWHSFTTKQQELSDNQISTANREFDYDDDDPEFDIWLCGAQKAASMDYGFCDEVDYIYFLNDYAPGTQLQLYTGNLQGESGLTAEILNMQGAVVGEFEHNDYMSTFSLSNLIYGQSYVVKLSVDSDCIVSGEMQFGYNGGYNYMNIA